MKTRSNIANLITQRTAFVLDAVRNDFHMNENQKPTAPMPEEQKEGETSTPPTESAGDAK